MNDTATAAFRNLDPPLSGYLFECVERTAYVPVIMSLREGHGDVGRLFDALKQTHDVIIVPTVLSRRLLGILERREFHEEQHHDPRDGQQVECWVWRRPREDEQAKLEGPPR